MAQRPGAPAGRDKGDTEVRSFHRFAPKPLYAKNRSDIPTLLVDARGKQPRFISEHVRVFRLPDMKILIWL